MQKTDMTVSRLVEMIAAKELRLPDIQRRYVWNATRVRDLIDSLYRGYVQRDVPSACIESVIHEQLHFATTIKRSQLAIQSAGLLPPQ